MTWPTDRVTARLRYDAGNLSTYLHWRWIDRTDNGAYMGAPLIGPLCPTSIWPCRM